MSQQTTNDTQLSASVVAEETRRRNARIGLLAPGMLTIFCIGIMPLSIVLVYSFLEPGDFGGVSWALSFDAYVQLLFEEDIFDETLSFSTDYLEISHQRWLTAQRVILHLERAGYLGAGI